MARPEPEGIPALLEPILRQQLPGSAQARIGQFARTTRGFATETYLFEADSGDRTVPLVLRRPPEEPLFPDYDLLRQVLVMQRLADTEIPVPAVAWLDRGTAALGSPYFVMSRLGGEAPSDFPSYHVAGNYFEASPADRARMWWGCVDTIAAIHRLDWQKLRLDFLGCPDRGTASTQHLVDYLDTALTWACGGPQPETYRRAIDHLRVHAYEPEQLTLCWGDARMSNILYDTEYRVSGVLDWEIAYLGNHEADLAWMLFLDWASSEYEGHPRLTGTPTREETIAYYEQRSGMRVHNLRYNEILAAVLLSIPLLRMAHRVRLPPEMDITGFCTTRIEQLLS
ncbi:phosphotransferase family protein [Nocardia cyriacigeorgica]|uniref:Phosphotransferase family protein n=1 Tax=Nocardia cyriacigeorgica TaxID=135487 RepID=A0A5R8NTP3_9NOCA|nr:phosphotransferase family protein [Nocardia cyriacigeorgica]TLF79087.1 phosphotransferase family protein [Nocardia cyriacigeorgica]